jgi:hypothetical protein
MFPMPQSNARLSAREASGSSIGWKMIQITTAS